MSAADTLRPSAAPLLTALQRRVARPTPTHTRLSGGRGSGRSVLLAHLRRSLGAPMLELDALPPGASPAAAILGTLLRHISTSPKPASADAPEAARLRLLARAAHDAEHHDRTEPAPIAPTTQLAAALRDAIPNALVLLLDGADGLASAEQHRLLRALALLRNLDLPVHLVVAIEPELPDVAHALPFALQLPPASSADVETLIADLVRRRSEGLNASQAGALPDAFSHLPPCTPRQVLGAAQAYLHVLHSEDPGPSDPQLDVDLAAWLAASHRWPALRQALRTRDIMWWRDLRLVLDQAIARRPDPMLDALFAEPGAPAFLMSRLPSPKGAGAHQLAATLQRWHAADARAARWGA